MEHYKPGLHILATFKAPVKLLKDAEHCRQLFYNLSNEYSLVSVGDVFHSFPDSGFTAVVCLTESHMSIHTWPEFEQATFDVFLSNYRNDNADKVRAIYNAVLQAFQAEVIQLHEVIR